MSEPREQAGPEGAQPEGPASGTPRFRPRDQFWPYVELGEEPSDEELARLDPDLQAALYDNPPARPFALTLVFQPFEGADYARAVELAKASGAYQESRTGGTLSHRASFRPDQVLELRNLWELVGRLGSSEVLLDGRPVPYARELWLPLFWFLIPR